MKATLTKDRRSLKAKGWTLIAAAEKIGVHHVHLMRVLNYERESLRTLRAARALPLREKKGALNE